MSLPEVSATISQVEAVIATVEAQVGKPYKFGADGPDAYDCSGLMKYIFAAHNLLYLIGNRRGTANWYANWFRSQNQFINIGDANATVAEGDLVFYGQDPADATHVGLCVTASPNLNLVVSALVNPLGVSSTRMLGIYEVGNGKLPVIGFGRPKYVA